ncbi:MAG: 50S ribosomal protein L29 [bacterium]|nr:50S ribosomal protein L29 [bacterium]
MKHKEFLELKTGPIEELEQKAGDLRDRLHALKMDLAAGKVKNVREIKGTKKDIARILTILSERANSPNN